ncbi:hypothetical protein CXF64_20110 [Pseudoalteromonas sp. GutCa3]|nr:hypothetical protein CXF64_20110 [Pseudoalteromonas sp. GutCa3]
MMKNLFYLVLLFSPFFSFADYKISKVEVFSDTSMVIPVKKSIPNVEVLYYILGEGANFKAAVNKNVPNNLADAQVYMNKYINSEEGANILNKIVDSYQKTGRAFSLGVKELPAIVIDERYVIYGSSNIVMAVNTLNTYLNNKDFKK